MPGSITFDRDAFFDDAIAKEPRCFDRQGARIDLYVRAAHSPHSQLVSGKLIHLQIGEQIASERFLEKRWSWSRTKVRSFISILKESGIVNHRTDQGETVLILCRYSELTKPPQKKEPAIRPRGDQGRTRGEPKDKELKEGNEGELTPPPSDALAMFSDSLPTEAAKDFDCLFETINRLHPSWAKHPHPTYTEKTTALANSKALFAISPDTWAKLAEFYAAIITADFQATYGKFWRPDNRGKFLESITDVLTSCDRWESALKDEKRRK